MKRVITAFIIASLVIIAVLANYGLPQSSQPAENNTMTASIMLDGVLEIEYTRPALDLIYTVPPPRDLYDSSISYVQNGIKYLKEASISDGFVKSMMSEAEEEASKASLDSWEGLFHALRARDAIIEAMAYINASKGTLTLEDVAKLNNTVSERLGILLAENRYYGDSLSEAIRLAYQSERHLYKAHILILQAAEILESNRPFEVRIVYSYSLLVAASTHMDIATYIVSNNMAGQDFTMDVLVLNEKLLDAVNKSIDPLGASATDIVREAERLLDRAVKTHGLGLHSYSIIDTLHAYMLLKASQSSELEDPGDSSWSVTASSLYKAKLNAIHALEDANTINDMTATLLLYRLYGYVDSGDTLVAKAIELNAASQGSSLLKTAYIEYMKAYLAAKHLREALSLLEA